MATAVKLASGKWRCQYTFDGVRKSVTRDTKREAEYAALEIVLKKKREVANKTVGQAIDEYIAMKDGVLAPSTIAGYRKIRRVNVPELMETRLADVNIQVMQKAFNKAAKAGASSKTLANVRGLLSAALKVHRIEVDVTIPEKQKRMVELLPVETVLSVVKGTTIEVPVLLAACLSLTMSEIRGLEYRDIKDGVLSVVRTVVTVENTPVERDGTKEFERRRKIPMPQYLVELIGTGEGKIVNLTCSALEKRWARLLAKKELPHMRFHDLRHLNASIMLALKIPDKYAMERGGWKTNSVMKNVYQHTFSSERKEVDTTMNDYFNELFAHENAHDSQKT